MIFTSIDNFKEFVGGAVNRSLELDSIAPAYHQVVQQSIIPLIGETLWATIDSTWDDTPSAAITALLPYVRRPIAQLTMYEYAAIGNVQFSEAGIVRMETESMKSAYKYQENAYREWMLNAGHEALEELQLFLMSNSGDYADWTGDDAYARSYELMINTARTFRAYYSKKVSRYVYEVLRPIIEEVEIFAIEPSIGEGQYNRLKAGILADDLTSDELILLQKLQRAICHFAVEEAMQRNFVQFDGDKVVRIEGTGDQASTDRMAASGREMTFAKRYHQYHAHRHLERAITYLDDNSDTYPLYAAFVEARTEAEAAEDAADSDSLTVRDGYPNPPTSDDDTGGIIWM